MSAFEQVWQYLQANLSKNQKVENWGVRGYSGNQFAVVECERNAILVKSLRTQNERRVTKSEFEKVYPYYQKLRSGQIGRAELGEATQSRNTSYILSLLNWYQSNR